MLAYTSQPYSEAVDMRPDVTYTPYATSSREKTGNIITFAQFEEGGLLSETCDDAKSGDESDDNSIMPQLISEEKWIQWIHVMSLMVNLCLRRC